MDNLLIVVTNHAALGTRGKRELMDFYHEIKDDFDINIVSTSKHRCRLTREV